MARYLPRITNGRVDQRGGDHRTRGGLRRGRHPHDAQSATATTGCSTAASCSSPTACTVTCIFVAARTGETRHAISMFIVEKGTPGFTRRARARQDRLASLRHRRTRVRQLPHPGRAICSAIEHEGFRSVMKNFQTERIALGGDGHRPLHAGARSSRSPTCASARPSAPRCGTSRRCASAWRCSMRRRARRASTSTTARGSSRRGATWCRTCRC